MLIGAFGQIKIAEISIESLKIKQDHLKNRLSIKPKSAFIVEKTDILIKKPDFTKIEFDKDLLNISYLDCCNAPDNTVLLNNFIKKSQQKQKQYKMNSNDEFQEIVINEPPPNHIKPYIKEVQVQFVKSEIIGEDMLQSSNLVSDVQLVQIMQAFEAKNIYIQIDKIKYLIDMFKSFDVDQLIEGYKLYLNEQ